MKPAARSTKLNFASQQPRVYLKYWTVKSVIILFFNNAGKLMIYANDLHADN